MAAAELASALKQESLTETGEDGKPFQLGEFQGYVSRNQRLNESARACQRRRRGTKGRRGASAKKEANAAAAAEQAAQLAANAEAARVAAEAEAARVAAEEEAARVAAEEEAAKVAEAGAFQCYFCCFCTVFVLFCTDLLLKMMTLIERAAATVLQCLWRREEAQLDYETMRRKWAGMQMMAATKIQALHRRKVAYWAFQFKKGASVSIQRFVRGKLLRMHYKRMHEGFALLLGVSRGVLGRVAYAQAEEAQRSREYAAATEVQRMAKGKLARADHKKKKQAAGLLNRVGRGAIARVIARDIREERRLEKERIMDRYAELMESGGDECQEAMDARNFGVAHVTHRDPEIVATREKLRVRLGVVRKAEREAEILRAVVNNPEATMAVIEAALQRSPEKYAAVLGSVMEARDTLERTMALRRTELSQWRRRLGQLVRFYALFVTVFMLFVTVFMLFVTVFMRCLLYCFYALFSIEEC